MSLKESAKSATFIAFIFFSILGGIYFFSHLWNQVSSALFVVILVVVLWSFLIAFFQLVQRI
jgi:hypothetical protein